VQGLLRVTEAGIQASTRFRRRGVWQRVVLVTAITAVTIGKSARRQWDLVSTSLFIPDNHHPATD